MTNHGNVDWGDEMRANQNKPKEQKTLREKLAKDLWFHGSKSRYQWEYLISTRKIAWYKKADSILSLMLKEVEGIENPCSELVEDIRGDTDPNPCYLAVESFREAVKKILGKV